MMRDADVDVDGVEFVHISYVLNVESPSTNLPRTSVFLVAEISAGVYARSTRNEKIKSRKYDICEINAKTRI